MLSGPRPSKLAVVVSETLVSAAVGLRSAASCSGSSSPRWEVIALVALLRSRARVKKKFARSHLGSGTNETNPQIVSLCYSLTRGVSLCVHCFA